MTEFKCNECDKEFTSKEAFDMHNNSKHYKAPKVKINKKKIKGWGIFFVLVLFVIAGGYGLMLYKDRPGEYDAFAQCITEAGAKEYGAYWCSNCATQKRLFGKRFQYVDYIECSLPNQGGQNEFCNDAGIEAYPTWEFADGERIEGVTELERLAVLTGCELN